MPIPSGCGNTPVTSWKATTATGWITNCPIGRPAASNVSPSLKQAGVEALLDACDLLVRPGKYEEVFTAILFATDSSELYSPDFFRRIGKWFEQGIANWAEVDVLAGQVLCQFLTKGIVDIAALKPWVASSYKYQRRAVPVTLIGVLKGTHDFKPLFRLIEPLMGDSEKVVWQGTRRSTPLTGRPARAAPHLPQPPGSCHTSRSGLATCVGVCPLCPSCPPGRRPLFFRNDRGAGLASPSLDGGPEEFRGVCRS